MKCEFEYRKDFGLPAEWTDLKTNHYKKVLEDEWEQVYNLSVPEENEMLFVAKVKDEIVGRCIVQFNKYNLRIRDFSVAHMHRGNGIAQEMLGELEKKAIEHSRDLVEHGLKDPDLDMMFLKSYIYLDAVCEEQYTENPSRFQMARYYCHIGFKPYNFNPKDLNAEEEKALEVFDRLDSNYRQHARVFKKNVSGGIKLREEVKQELNELTGEQREKVISGLETKLGVYQKKGYIPFQYDKCNICKEIGSTLEAPKCGFCYIEKACREPFNQGFQLDNEVSFLYFSAMKEYLEAKK